MENQELAWKETTYLLQRFLDLTKSISDLLADADAENYMEELETLVDERSMIIEDVSRIDTLSVPEKELSKEEEKQKWLCGELLLQIQEFEKSNVEGMTKIMNDNKAQMRSNRQSRDTIGAYNKQMQETVQEGTLFNKTK